MNDTSGVASPRPIHHPHHDTVAASRPVGPSWTPPPPPRQLVVGPRYRILEAWCAAQQLSLHHRSLQPVPVAVMSDLDRLLSLEGYGRIAIVLVCNAVPYGPGVFDRLLVLLKVRRFQVELEQV